MLSFFFQFLFTSTLSILKSSSSMGKKPTLRIRSRHRHPPSPTTTSQLDTQSHTREEEDDDDVAETEEGSVSYPRPRQLQSDTQKEDQVEDDEDDDVLQESQIPDDGYDNQEEEEEEENGSFSYAAGSSSSRSPSTYINVAPLPVFHGRPGECPVTHLTRFDRVCQANNATSPSTIVNIFPVTLLDEASIWYELLPTRPDNRISWDDIRSAFLDAYRVPEDCRSDLMSMKQNGKERVRSYCIRFQWVLKKKWPEHGMKEEVLIGIFTDGLSEGRCRSWVVLQRPKSLEEAFGVAVGWERAESVNVKKEEKEEVEGEEVAELKCGFCDGGHEESGCVVRKMMKELWLRSGVGERKEGRGGEISGLKKEGQQQQQQQQSQQCMCWKHQCWKRFDRSTSAPVHRLASVNSNQ